jgi:hypothetical protein
MRAILAIKEMLAAASEEVDMSRFATILSERKIDIADLVRRSAKLERERSRNGKRWRGVSHHLVMAAARGAPVSRRVRGKLLWALHDIAAVRAADRTQRRTGFLFE